MEKIMDRFTQMKIWHLIAIACLAFVMLILISGCKDLQHKVSHMKSSMFGLNRTVTMYDLGGGVIREWEGDFKVEIEAGVARFVNQDGKVVIMAGIYVIEEK